jgi:hypothetical protein
MWPSNTRWIPETWVTAKNRPARVASVRIVLEYDDDRQPLGVMTPVYSDNPMTIAAALMSAAQHLLTHVAGEKR